ncbi:MAG: hypothetical protein J6S43_05765 [Lentisphaeria bacterium]|nr:hypothetical protein [Lentisphaeria bacterium]
MTGMICRIMLTIAVLGGGFFSARAEDELSRLRKDNRELRDKLIQAERELTNYRLWLANAAFDHTRMQVSEREQRQLLLLEELSRRSNALSMTALAIGDECRRLLTELPLGPVRKAQVELRLEELEKCAGHLAGLTIPGNSEIGSCRILAVDHQLKVAVISAGSSDGVFPGMVFHVKAKPQLKLRVIGTHTEGAVAEAIAGEIKDFAPGMEMSALHQVKEAGRPR